MLLHGWSVSSVSVTLGAGNPDHAAGGGGAGALNADEEQFQLQVRDLRYTSRFTSARLHKCTGVGARLCVLEVCRRNLPVLNAVQVSLTFSLL